MRSMTIFNYLLEATVFGSVLILLLCTVRFFLRDKLGNRYIYIAWLLIALRVLIPITLPNPAMDEYRPALSTDATARPVADQIRTRFIDALSSIPAVTAANASKSNISLSPLQSLAIKTSQGETGNWVLCIYVGIALGIGMCFLISYIRFRKKTWRNRVAPFEGEDLETYETLLGRYKVKKIPVYFVDRLPKACIVGVFKPFIAVPLHTSKEHLPLVLAHTICHQKVHDGVWGLIRNLCCIVQWYNPLIWMAASLNRIDCELACDDRVTRKLQDLDRLAYANALVSISEHKGSMPYRITTATELTSKRLKERIVNVIRFGHVKRWVVAVTSACAIVVLILAFATSESSTLPTIDEIPTVDWAASLTYLPDEENASAYARRFLESPFIGIDTSAYDLTIEQQDDQWHVLAKNHDGSRSLWLRFDMDGRICEYDGSQMLGGLTLADLPRSERRFSRSLNAYIKEFLSALIPDIHHRSGIITADITEDDLRCIQGQLIADDNALVHDITVQIKPTARIICYSAGDTSRLIEN